MTGLILAATHVVTTPDLPKVPNVDTSGAREMIGSFAGSPAFKTIGQVVLVGLLLWFACSRFGWPWLRLVALGYVVLIGISWLGVVGDGLVAIGYVDRKMADAVVAGVWVAAVVGVLFIGVPAMKKRRTRHDRRMEKAEQKVMLAQAKRMARKGSLRLGGRS